MNKMDKIIHVCNYCGNELTDKEYNENTPNIVSRISIEKVVFCDNCFKGVDEIQQKISKKREELNILNDELDDYITNFSRKEVESE